PGTPDRGGLAAGRLASDPCHHRPDPPHPRAGPAAEPGRDPPALPRSDRPDRTRAPAATPEESDGPPEPEARMPDVNTPVLAAIGGLVLLATLIGVGVGFLVVRSATRGREAQAARAPAAPSAVESEVRAAEVRIQEMLEQARQDADRIRKDAELRSKEEAYRLREELNRELEAARTELREQERRAEKREDAAVEKARELAKKERHVEHLQKKLADRREALEKKSKELDALIEQETKKLHEITGLTREQAEKMLLDRLERELAAEVAARIQRSADQLRAESEARAREVLATAIQRYAAQHTTDTTVSTVDIPDDNMKGRIIGREGRNIRTFE